MSSSSYRSPTRRATTRQRIPNVSSNPAAALGTVSYRSGLTSPARHGAAAAVPKPSSSQSFTSTFEAMNISSTHDTISRVESIERHLWQCREQTRTMPSLGTPLPSPNASAITTNSGFEQVGGMAAASAAQESNVSSTASRSVPHPTTTIPTPATLQSGTQAARSSGTADGLNVSSINATGSTNAPASSAFRPFSPSGLQSAIATAAGAKNDETRNLMNSTSVEVHRQIHACIDEAHWATQCADRALLAARLSLSQRDRQHRSEHSQDPLSPTGHHSNWPASRAGGAPSTVSAARVQFDQVEISRQHDVSRSQVVEDNHRSVHESVARAAAAFATSVADHIVSALDGNRQHVSHHSLSQGGSASGGLQPPSSPVRSSSPRAGTGLPQVVLQTAQGTSTGEVSQQTTRQTRSSYPLSSSDIYTPKLVSLPARSDQGSSPPRHQQSTRNNEISDRQRNTSPPRRSPRATSDEVPRRGRVLARGESSSAALSLESQRRIESSHQEVDASYGRAIRSPVRPDAVPFPMLAQHHTAPHEDGSRDHRDPRRQHEEYHDPSSLAFERASSANVQGRLDALLHNQLALKARMLAFQSRLANEDADFIRMSAAERRAYLQAMDANSALASSVSHEKNSHRRWHHTAPIELLEERSLLDQPPPSPSVLHKCATRDSAHSRHSNSSAPHSHSFHQHESRHDQESHTSSSRGIRTGSPSMAARAAPLQESSRIADSRDASLAVSHNRHSEYSHADTASHRSQGMHNDASASHGSRHISSTSGHGGRLLDSSLDSPTRIIGRYEDSLLRQQLYREESMRREYVDEQLEPTSSRETSPIRGRGAGGRVEGEQYRRLQDAEELSGGGENNGVGGDDANKGQLASSRPRGGSPHYSDHDADGRRYRSETSSPNASPRRDGSRGSVHNQRGHGGSSSPTKSVSFKESEGRKNGAVGNEGNRVSGSSSGDAEPLPLHHPAISPIRRHAPSYADIGSSGATFSSSGFSGASDLSVSPMPNPRQSSAQMRARPASPSEIDGSNKRPQSARRRNISPYYDVSPNKAYSKRGTYPFNSTSPQRATTSATSSAAHAHSSKSSLGTRSMGNGSNRSSPASRSPYHRRGSPLPSARPREGRSSNNQSRLRPSPSQAGEGPPGSFYVQRALELREQWGELVEKNPHFLVPRSMARDEEHGSILRQEFRPSAAHVDGHIPGMHRSVSRERRREQRRLQGGNSYTWRSPGSSAHQAASGSTRRDMGDDLSGVSPIGRAGEPPNVSPRSPSGSSPSYTDRKGRGVHPATAAADRLGSIPTGMLGGGGPMSGLGATSPRYCAPTASSLEHSSLKYQVEYVLTRRDELSRMEPSDSNAYEAQMASPPAVQRHDRSSSRGTSASSAAAGRAIGANNPVRFGGGENGPSLSVAREVAQQLSQRYLQPSGSRRESTVSGSLTSLSPPPTTHRVCEDGLCNELGLR